MRHLEQFPGTEVHKTDSGGFEPPGEKSRARFEITIDGSPCQTHEGERLIDLANRLGPEIPQVCYHPQLGPIQTCDTCLVEVNGKLSRACATVIEPNMRVSTNTPAVKGLNYRLSIRFSRITISIAPSVTITMATVQSTTRRPFSTCSIRASRSSRNRMRSIPLILFTDTILANASSADGALKPARTSR
jgi:hypothetical protein